MQTRNPKQQFTVLNRTTRDAGVLERVKNQIQAGEDEDFNNNSCPLHLAVLRRKEGDKEKIREQLKAHANVNIQKSNGETVLHLAVKKGHLEMVHEFIHAGANVNLKNSHGDT